MNSDKEILANCFNYLETFTNNKCAKHSKNYILRSCNIRIEYESSELFSLFHPVISHLEAREHQKNDLQIIVCNQNSENKIDLNFIEKLKTIAVKFNCHPESKPICYYENENGQLSYSFDGEVKDLCYLNRSKKTAIALYDSSHHSLEGLSGSLASPFRTIFSWYFEDKSCSILHASAIGNEKCAALVLGPSGSGKSTTALACLNAGLKFAGDDSVLVSMKNGPEVFSLYRSIKLFQEDVALFDTESLKIQHQQIGSKNKSQLLLSNDSLNSLLISARLKVIILPKIVVGGDTFINDIATTEAFAISASTCLTHIPNSRQKALSSLKSILVALPCYRLTISDRDKIAPILKNLLDI